MKVVIDCNVFVSCLSSKSHCHKIIKTLYKGKFTLALSTEIYFEYKEKLYEKYAEATVLAFLEALEFSPFVLSYINYYSWDLIKSDRDDNKYVDAYLTSSSDYLVTNDNHFNVLKSVDFPKINVINVDAFVEVIRQL
jgi:putative PIN family toxin of toxin-antitoxin system